MLVAALMLAGCAPGGLTSQVGADPAADFVAMTNADRAAAGVQPLRVDPTLTSLATRWAEHLAATGIWTHQDMNALLDGPVRGYGWVAENIGTIPVGVTEQELEELFLADEAHRANLLRPRDNVIGVGVATDANGTTWIVVDFGEH